MTKRQTQILNTAIEVLAHKGLAHLTHRAVDARAGLPQGSTSYYFSKKQDLIEATASHLAHLLENDCIDVKKQFAEMIADGKREAAISFVSTDLVKFAQEKSDWLLARYELTLCGARDPLLRPVADRLSKAANEPISFFLKLLSTDLNDRQIEVCQGILDGLCLLYVTGQGPLPDEEQIKRLFLTTS